MSTFDKIGDLIIRLKNSSKTYISEVIVLNSKLVREILECLESLGYIVGYKEINYKHVKVYLKYKYNQGVISDCKRISKISKRVYWSYKDLLEYKKRNIIIVYTSNQGILSNASLDFEIKKEGGEPLFSIK